MSFVHTEISREKRRGALALVCALLLCFGCLFMAGCTSSQQEEQITSFDQLKGKRIGYMTGAITIDYAEEMSGSTDLTYGFNAATDAFLALQTGKIDAFMFDEPPAIAIMNEMKGMKALDEYVAPSDYGAIFQKNNAESSVLLAQFNEFIASLKSDGTLEQILDLWFYGEESEQVVDTSGITGDAGTINIAISSSVGKPGAYVKDGAYCGFEVDLAYRFARAYGYEPELLDTDFSGTLAAVAGGKSDFAMAEITITDERKKSYNFSDPYYIGGIVASVRDTSVSSTANPLDSLMSSFTRTFVNENRWQLFAKGMLTTLIITLFSIAFGTLLGFAVFMLCKNGGRIRTKIVDACVWLISGMPIVVLLMVMFYIVFAALNIDALAVSIVAFTLVFACSVLGMLRVGVGAVDSGQVEAARAMGYSNWRGFRTIILPQALTHMLPIFRSEAISLLKATAVVGYIAVQDLTKMGDIIRSATYEAFFPLIAVAVVYFVLEGFLKLTIDIFQKRVNVRLRSKEAILSGCCADDASAESAFEKIEEKTHSVEIVLEHVGKDFGTVAPLHDVYATIRTGDVISVVGPSGCGKTTLLRALNLLDAPTSGRILLDGEDITAKGYDATKVNRRIGMVFQRWNLFGHWTVIENIMLPQVQILGRTRQQAYAYSMQLLESVGLSHKALEYPNELSGGQQQRVAIARTLGMDPDVILFDEPTSALDSGMVGEVQAVIAQLANRGRTILIVTHDMAFARQVCNRVFFMDEGGIYEDGTPKQVFDNPQTEKARKFMLRIASLTLEHRIGVFDTQATERILEDFCLRSSISAHCCMRMMLISEEACANILPTLLPSGTVVRVDYACSAVKNTGTITLSYTGPKIDLSESADQLAWKFLNGISSGIEYTVVESAPADAADAAEAVDAAGAVGAAGLAANASAHEGTEAVAKATTQDGVKAPLNAIVISFDAS